MARTGADAASKQRMHYRGLRGWLEQVDKMGELRKVDGAHWDVEMGAVTHMLTETSRGTGNFSTSTSSPSTTFSSTGPSFTKRGGSGLRSCMRA